LLAHAPRFNVSETILVFHVAIITFNVVGLIVIPLGSWLGWRFVHIVWLRLLHLGLLAAVAGQALAGRACILTIWQTNLAGYSETVPPLIMLWLNHLIYWNLPFWMFTLIYVLVFAYVVALWIPVPPRHSA
jgi:hypothetical protein